MSKHFERGEWKNIENLIVSKKLYGITDKTGYFDDTDQLLVVDKNNQIKRTFTIDTLVNAVYSIFSPVPSIDVDNGVITLKDKYKNGTVDFIADLVITPHNNETIKISNTSLPIEVGEDLIDFTNNTSHIYVLVGNLPMELYDVITFLFFVKFTSDDSNTEALLNYGNMVEFYRENNNIHLIVNQTDDIIISSNLSLNEVKVIGVSFDIPNQKIYLYRDKKDKDPNWTEPPILLLNFTHSYDPEHQILPNNQIEIGKNQTGHVAQSVKIGSVHFSTRLHTTANDFWRLERGVQIVSGFTDIQDLKIDTNVSNNVLGVNNQEKIIVKLDTTYNDLRQIYYSFNIIPSISVQDGQLILSQNWKDSANVIYPNQPIHIIETGDNLYSLDFTNNSSNSYISVSNLPLLNYALKSFAIRFHPLNLTDKEALLSYGTGNNKIEFYKEANYVICSLFKDGATYDINVNLEQGSAKKPLFWYNYAYNDGNPNLGTNTDPTTDRVGGNLSNGELLLNTGSNLYNPRGIPIFEDTGANKQLAFCLWMKIRHNNGTNFGGTIQIRSTFNWRRMAVQNNFRDIVFRGQYSNPLTTLNTGVALYSHNTIYNKWVFLGVSYEGNSTGEVNFVFKDEDNNIISYEQTLNIGGERQNFNDNFFVNDFGDTGFQLDTMSSSILVENVKVYNEHLSIFDLNEVYDNQRQIKLGEINPIKADTSNVIALSLDPSNDKVYHYLDGNIFNTTHLGLSSHLPDFSQIDDVVEIGKLSSDTGVVNNSYIGGFVVYPKTAKTLDEFLVMGDGMVKVSRLLDLNDIPETSDNSYKVLCVDTANNVYKR